MNRIVIAILGICAAALLIAAANINGPAGESLALPAIVVCTNYATNVFTARAGDPANRKLIRILQNTGTQPVLYALGTNVSAAGYSGVLAPGTAVRDGKGGWIDLSYWGGSVTVMSETSTGMVATVEMLGHK